MKVTPSPPTPPRDAADTDCAQRLNHPTFPQDFLDARNVTNPARKHGARADLGKTTYVIDTALLEEVIRSRMSPVGKGMPIDGIPGTNPCAEKRAISLMNMTTGQVASVGDLTHHFSQQSMSKPIAMALAIHLMDNSPDRYRQYVGMEASALPYNAPALSAAGRPLNSSVNIGALATWLLIQVHTPQNADPFSLYLETMTRLTGNPGLIVNEEMADGEFRFRPLGDDMSRNQRLLAKLEEIGFIDDESLMRYARRKHDAATIAGNSTADGSLTPGFARSCRQALSEDAFLSYCRACAVMVNTEDMVRVAAVFRNGGVRVDAMSGAGKQVLPAVIADYVQRSNDIGGSYEESETQYTKNRFGGKTGVDGGIFGSLYRHANLVVATHHSDLNPVGNSGEGQKWINTLNRLNLKFPVSGAGRRPHTFFLKRARSIFMRVQPNALGPSPRDIDRRLQAEMTVETRRALEDAMPLVDGQRQGFFAKRLNDEKSKHPMPEGSHLTSAPDIHGNMKRYYYMRNDGHALAKIVVVDESHGSEGKD